MRKLEAIGDHRALTGKFRRLLQRDRNSLLFAEFADHLRRVGSISEATAICARGLMQNPGYATGHVVMGEIFRDAGITEKAEEHWREALRLDPGHPRAHLRMGELHLDRGESEQAAAAFEAAAVSNPEPGEARTPSARNSGEVPEELEDQSAEASAHHSWRPGERPKWLTSGRFGDLVDAVRRGRSVERAMLVNAEGQLLASSTPTQTDDSPGLGVQLVTEAQDLLRRLGAGRLRTASICGVEGSLRCVALGDLTLMTTLKPDSPVGVAQEEAAEAMASMVGSAAPMEKCDG